MGLANYEQQVACLVRLDEADVNFRLGAQLLKQAIDLAKSGWGTNADSVLFENVASALYFNKMSWLSMYVMSNFVVDAKIVLNSMNELNKIPVNKWYPKQPPRYLEVPGPGLERPVIRIRTDVMMEAAALLDQAGKRVQLTQDAYRRAESQLDHLILVQQDLKGRLSGICISLQEVTATLNGTVRYLRKAIQIYEATERRIARKAEEIKVPEAPALSIAIIGRPHGIDIPLGPGPRPDFATLLKSSFEDSTD